MTRNQKQAHTYCNVCTIKPLIISTLYVLCNALFKSFRRFFAWRPTLELELQIKFHLYIAFAARCRSLASWCACRFSWCRCASRRCCASNALLYTRSAIDASQRACWVMCSIATLMTLIHSARWASPAEHKLLNFAFIPWLTFLLNGWIQNSRQCQRTRSYATLFVPSRASASPVAPASTARRLSLAWTSPLMIVTFSSTTLVPHPPAIQACVTSSRHRSNHTSTTNQTNTALRPKWFGKRNVTLQNDRLFGSFLTAEWVPSGALQNYTVYYSSIYESNKYRNLFMIIQSRYTSTSIARFRIERLDKNAKWQPPTVETPGGPWKIEWEKWTRRIMASRHSFENRYLLWLRLLVISRFLPLSL